MIRFGHISDTHLPGTIPNAFLEKICREIRDPWENFTSCLTELAAAQVDFVLHAGDVMHGGQDVDYARVWACFEQYLPGVPVILAPGNHDHRGVFWRDMSHAVVLEDGGIVQDVKLGCGVRVLVLDTLRKAAADALSEKQLDWLEVRLAEPTKGATFLLMHHPPVWQDPIFAVPSEGRFARMLAGSDVLAVFAGHTHQNLCTYFAGKPLYVADSLAVGMKSKKGSVSYHSRLGYHLCELDEEGRIGIENCLPYSHIKSIKK